MAKIVGTISKKVHDLRDVLSIGSRGHFRHKFLNLHPRDQARYLLRNNQKARVKIYSALAPDELADILGHIELKRRVLLFKELDMNKASQTLASMYVDDAVDIIRHLEQNQSKEYMSRLEDELEASIRTLLHYKELTAGSLMTTELLALSPRQSASEALEILKQRAAEVVTIYYAFVVDEAGRLTGVVSLKELLMAKKDTLVENIVSSRVISVDLETSGTEVAKLMKEYNFLALPVVDSDHRLVGVITIDDVVDVIDAQAGDRYQRFGAAHDVELTDGPFISAYKRLPWLVLLLFLGMITATLIGYFESTIAEVAILGAFIPVVAGTTGNSGTQSLAIMVRGIATNKLAELSVARYFLKESVTAITTSVICGLALTAIIFIWKDDIYIGLVAGGALTLSIFVGTLAGSAIPLGLKKLKIDPAVASGPLITTICDIISMGIYFSIATLLMSKLI